MAVWSQQFGKQLFKLRPVMDMSIMWLSASYCHFQPTMSSGNS